ncbi:MAG TPA: hypothetical protein VJH23_01195 [archaeon]|nr:hypothetical protein [archaeon]
MEKQTSVFFSKAKGRKYFKVSVPYDFAVNLLGLRTDINGQKLTWRVQDKQIIVSGAGT